MIPEIKNHYDVILVGAGHAHLGVLLGASRFPENTSLLVIAPRFFLYTGLAASCLAGETALEDCTVDVAKLCKELNIEYLNAKVSKISTEQRLISAGPCQIQYSICSFAIGSKINSSLAETTGVKKYQDLKDLKLRLATLKKHTAYRISVVGGGAAGCETAHALYRHATRNKLKLLINLYQKGNRLLPGWSPAAGKKTLRELKRTSVKVHFEKTEDTQDEWLINCSGISANTVCGLSTGPEGKVQVDNTLCVAESRYTVFAAGDCIEFQTGALPNLGVFAVKQSATLLKNIDTALRGTDSNRPFTTYTPQRTVLQILNLGSKSILQWGIPGGPSLCISGKWTYSLKNAIDRRYISKFLR